MAKLLNLDHVKYRLCKLELKLRAFGMLEDPVEVLKMLLQIGAKC